MNQIIRQVIKWPPNNLFIADVVDQVEQEDDEGSNVKRN